MSEITPEDKVYYCKQYTEGKMTQGYIARITGLAKASIYMWIKQYESMGADAFLHRGHKHYPIELKIQAVKDYLSGEDSQYGICKKYCIKSTTQLQKWILMYNGQGKIKSSGTGGATIMTKGRKTTFEERVQIVQYCISHDHNYAETAEEYQISYQQARSYTIKYEANGVDGLQDKRGRRKPEMEMTELERLRAENKILRAQKERTEMEVSFLKKLKEIERRWG